ncbi:hypothetical protein UA32_16365 [Photobacterium angustum]|uniref:Uncharacterized protein n=1 Tax=Photobacterium angustum TaxID=661 RepID=A0ABX5H9M9_PHOAN|nr:hypothetical protein [Photobacterium angustum]KJG36575.1 hypothetical protein UA32_16365 [Photobacterium angustum]PSX12389.1 hypothetical protein C0W27_04165 [Photobacterium angustum]
MLKVSCFLVASLVCSSAIADEVSDLRDMAKLSEEYRDLSIDCLVEMKVKKMNGWASDNCNEYKDFAKNDLQTYKVKIKKTTSSFVEYSKSENVSMRKVKRGLKQLFIIQSNMDSIDKIRKKIKVAANT